MNVKVIWDEKKINAATRSHSKFESGIQVRIQLESSGLNFVSYHLLLLLLVMTIEMYKKSKLEKERFILLYLEK